MADNSKLPFLIRLVDDKSPTVRAKVARELVAFGPRLEQELDGLGLSLSPEQKALVDEIMGQAPLWDDETLRRLWPAWMEQENDMARLEEALDLLARWQNAVQDESGEDEHQIESARNTPLAVLLDEVADDFLRSGRESTPQELSEWLFSRAGRDLRGATPDGAYHPQHSNLMYVIQKKRGIPISLACVFILVGHRLGLEIGGCNFPGHFLARAPSDSKSDSKDHGGTSRAFSAGFGRARAHRDESRDLFFDCFNGGRLLSDDESDALLKAAPHAMSTTAPAVAIVARVLRNLVVAFEQTGSPDKARLMISLLSDLERLAEEA